ncbi:NAD(P)H-dependent oxidoreductase [Castellaniella daejeonensis]|jgi:multimeric flavodoxin WrbA|uniref:NAD(P)H-dependent oxidoreductase n=1 Tax=Castellaniella daejeonensis TaxID=659013 RepID=A0ABN0U1B7_9BURK|nr:NAD(P)H-dependent oxidoreductase [Castellaniella sp.]HET8704479.1 NAD(P)H-dependent oxidoreductase [Castellaniella sp.]
MTTQLLIIWHSRTGAARQMAQAAAAGAQAVADELEAGDRFDLQVRPADTVRAENLLAADGYIFAAPENLAALSGAMKECLDRNYYHVLDRINGRPYAAMITAGSDGDGARRQLERICTGWRLKAVAPTLIVPMRAQTPEAILAPKVVPEDWLARGAELGGTLAALLL